MMNVISDRQNTLVCVFEMNSPRISAYEIHEWIHETMKLQPTDVIMIQIDAPKRQVYLKLRDDKLIHQLLQTTTGQLKYKHPNGEVSNVKIETAGTRTSRVRLANLPPEIGESIVRNALAKYGEVQEINHENWANTYRYPVANGIRVINMKLKMHIPSNMMMAGHRVLITYEGQPITCFGCGAVDHLYIACPNRRKQTDKDAATKNRTWANIAAGGIGGGDIEPVADNPSVHMGNAQGAKQIDEGQQNPTPKSTHTTRNNTDECGKLGNNKTGTTQNKGEEYARQPMDTMTGIQTVETKQTIRTRHTTEMITDEEQTLDNDTVSGNTLMQGQTKMSTDQQEAFRWAEDIETSPEAEETPELNLATSPKRIKKLKLEKTKPNPPTEEGRDRGTRGNGTRKSLQRLNTPNTK